jgi:hypothetical protein
MNAFALILAGMGEKIRGAENGGDQSAAQSLRPVIIFLLLTGLFGHG